MQVCRHADAWISHVYWNSLRDASFQACVALAFLAWMNSIVSVHRAPSGNLAQKTLYFSGIGWCDALLQLFRRFVWPTALTVSGSRNGSSASEQIGIESVRAVPPQKSKCLGSRSDCQKYYYFLRKNSGMSSGLSDATQSS